MKPISMKQDTRQYDFIVVPEQFAEDVAFATCTVDNFCEDTEARRYINNLLVSLYDPEELLITSKTQTDDFDAIEDYFYNRVLCDCLELHEDIVYKFLSGFKEFFEGRGAFEMCHNIRKALEILDKWQNGLSNADIDLGF